MPVANILDPIHDTLDPRVWDDPGSDKPVLKPKHLHWIKKTIYDALEKAGYTDVEKWLHLVLTGSLTTYQYSDESDCDVSLFVDAKALPEWSRAEMIGVMVSNVDGTTLPGTPHPMQDFVVGRGIGPHDLYKKGLRSGYDLDTQTWVEPPDRTRVHDVEAEENGFYAYALQMADKMERLLKYEPEKAVEFWHAIHKRRQRDMSAGKGDFAESNIVYKFLANRGLFPAISEASGEYIAAVKKTAGGDWFAPSYMIPDETKQQIHEWTQGQQWPEGTKFQDPSKYHVTGIYSPEGFANPEHQQWANSRSGISYPVMTTGVDSFTPAEGKSLTPTVLRVHNPDLINDTEGMLDEAEQRGLPVSRFPGGYKPHITVAHTPTQVQLEHPNLQFPVGPLRDLHSYYDELKQRQGKKVTATNVLYNQFRPEKFHPPAPGHEKSMPWVYDPDTQTVHLGPPRAYHWELIERTPELRDQYEGAWTKPAMGQGGNIHGAMSWPGRNTDFMGEQVDPETKRSINQALGAPEEDEHEWNFA